MVAGSLGPQISLEIQVCPYCDDLPETAEKRFLIMNIVTDRIVG
jgi:hypothetical protein